MFLKPFKIRTNTSIKGSDRKKLRQELLQTYPGVDGDAIKDLVPNKDDMTLMKITTHGGENVLVYCVNKNPMFFANELDRIIFPTVYALWRLPNLMDKVFATWPPVLDKLAKGADLMLPGVIVTQPMGPKALGTFPKGLPCAVKVLGNKCPVCVGTTALSAEDMFYSAMRGKGVISLHVYQDYLWAHGDKSEPPMLPDTELLQAMQDQKQPQDDGEGEDEDEASADMEQLSIQPDAEENKGEERADEKPEEEITANEDGKQDDNEEKQDEGATGEDIEDDGKMSKEQMDELLEQCFLSAIKAKVKKSDLPLLTSKFYKEFMQPCCPSNKEMDVRKSSSKKLGKFLAGMKQKGYIAIKEQPKGVEKITEIHKDHPDVRSFKVPTLEVREEEASGVGAGAAGGDTSTQPPQITEMFTLTAAAMPLFKQYGFNKGSTLTMQQVRQTIREYVKTNELDKQTPGSVTLDPTLSDLLQSRSEYHERLAWEDVFTRCQNALSPAFKVSVPGQPDVVKKGKLEPITLNVATRSGNKKVTLVHNLEVYGIDLGEFAHSVQKGVACSTSVTPLPGKQQGKEVLVQGNQIHYIEQLLTQKYQLPKKFIKGLEKAPKKKR